jgi:hypothetical protein
MNELIEARVKSKKKPAYELDPHTFDEGNTTQYAANNVTILS